VVKSGRSLFGSFSGLLLATLLLGLFGLSSFQFDAVDFLNHESTGDSTKQNKSKNDCKLRNIE
jgi:hypothetical protein